MALPPRSRLERNGLQGEMTTDQEIYALLGGENGVIDRAITREVQEGRGPQLRQRIDVDRLRFALSTNPEEQASFNLLRQLVQNTRITEPIDYRPADMAEAVVRAAAPWGVRGAETASESSPEATAVAAASSPAGRRPAGQQAGRPAHNR